MSYDLLLKNGRVVDGSGMPSFIGDVAVKDGRIAARGRISDGADRVINCDGLVIAPGFIDMHTHYDAQAFWDPLLSSSCWHGVTSVIMSNCGFALAPCKPEDRDYWARTLSTVEGMSLDALEKALPWNWESFAEYLSALEGRLGLNVGAMAGHSAIRRYVMGEQANARPATAGEVDGMRMLLRSMLAAGAFGLSTSRSASHIGYYGEPVPSAMAERDELLALAEVVGDFGVGGIEVLPRDLIHGLSQEEGQLLIDLSLASGKQVNWNELSQRADLPDSWRPMLDFMEEAEARGAQIYGIARCVRYNQSINVGNSQMFRLLPRWQQIMQLPFEEKLRALADPTIRPLLRQQVDDNERVTWRLTHLYVAEPALKKHEALRGRRMLDLAAEQGQHPVDALLDLAVEERLDTEFEARGVINPDDSAVERILSSRHAVVGISDAGAHNDIMVGADYTTAFLSYWVRERRFVSLEEAVRRLSFVPASLVGLVDRGLIREGWRADLAVFDLNRIQPGDKQIAHDLPGGGRRLIQKAEGIEYTIVNGQVLMEHGEHTGELPGMVLRSVEH